MFRVAIVVLLALNLGGCAGTVGSMVREADKDPAFSFDGNYLMTVDHPGGRQEMGSGWYIDCSGTRLESPLTIANSEISWQAGPESVVNGFIDSNGKFRLEQLLEDDIRSDSTLSDGSITLILQGDVSGDVMKGLLVYGVAQFTKKGCSYPVSYSKG
ncbi:MAG: hypothetical protein AB8B87_08045 [Granulosicoccus sp.]